VASAERETKGATASSTMPNDRRDRHCLYVQEDLDLLLQDISPLADAANEVHDDLVGLLAIPNISSQARNKIEASIEEYGRRIPC